MWPKLSRVSAAPLVTQTGFGQTFAERPRAGVARPLIRERAHAHLPDAFLGDELWFELCHQRFDLPRPWQRVIEHRREGARGELVAERFFGVTIADVERCVSEHQRLLPLEAWLTLATELIDAFEGLDPQRLRSSRGLSSHSVGWSLSGELVLSAGVLNSIQYGSGPEAAGHTSSPGFSWTPLETARGLPATPASLASLGLNAAVHLLIGVPHFRGEGDFDTLNAIVQHRPTLPSTRHPEANDWVDAAVRRGAARADDPERWASPGQLSSWLRGQLEPAPRAQAIAALFTLCAAPLRREFAIARTQAAWLPDAWEGVYPGGASPAAGLAVFEDQLLEARLSLESFPRAKTAPALAMPQPARLPWHARALRFLRR